MYNSGIKPGISCKYLTMKLTMKRRIRNCNSQDCDAEHLCKSVCETSYSEWCRQRCDCFPGSYGSISSINTGHVRIT